jgi:hypothetical protein
MAGRTRLTAPGARSAKALGNPTRGTTNPNRLRRCDRWLTGTHWVRNALVSGALVVDLGYGASPVTTVELARRLGDVRVLGLEIDPARVLAGQAVAHPPGLDFRLGGFELAGTRPALVRAFNVLRQYDETEVADAWATMTARLAPGGLLVEGTCDELGRRCCWVTLDRDGPRTLTLACRPSDLEQPSDLAERLPKVLIHRNVPGERVHDLFAALDRCWAVAAPFGGFGPRARWTEAVALLAKDWPVLDRRRRWRLGEVTLDWAAVTPR